MPRTRGASAREGNGNFDKTIKAAVLDTSIKHHQIVSLAPPLISLNDEQSSISNALNSVIDRPRPLTLLRNLFAPSEYLFSAELWRARQPERAAKTTASINQRRNESEIVILALNLNHNSNLLSIRMDRLQLIGARRGSARTQFGPRVIVSN